MSKQAPPLTDDRTDPASILEINQARADLSAFLTGLNPPDKGAITFVGDGTGFGKTYGVFSQFVKDVEVSYGEGFRNLYFITPQKAQIDMPDRVIADARKKGIRIIPVLPVKTDARDLDFKDWVTGETNEDKFKTWHKRASSCLKRHQSQNDKNILIKIQGVLGDVQAIRKVERLEKISRDAGDDESADSHRHDKELKKDNLYKFITDMARDIINVRHGIQDFVDKSIQGQLSDTDELMIDVLAHTCPFEVARIGTSILLSSAKKFETGVYISRAAGERSERDYTLSAVPIDDLVGMKKTPKSKDLDALFTDLTTREGKYQFIRDRHFVTDEENPFYQQGVIFNFIVDEEHESYGGLQKSCVSEIMNDEPLVESVCSAVYRIVRATDNVGAEYAPKADDALDIYQRIQSAISDYCELSEGVTLERILFLFRENIERFYLNAGDVDQVKRLIGSAFNFSAKRFLNEESLKSIKIVNPPNGLGEPSSGILKIYQSNDPTDDNPSLYDFYQVMLSILYVFANIEKEFDAFFKELTGGHPQKGLKGEMTQYDHLTAFKNKAEQNRAFINEIITRPDNKNPEIDYFYAYFFPKMILSIEKRRETHHQFKSMQGGRFVEVLIKIDVLKHLPEAMIMKMAYNTRNQVVLMSATSNFRTNYNFSFNRDCLDHFTAAEVFDIKTRECGESDVSRQIEVRKRRRAFREDVSYIRLLDTTGPSQPDLLPDDLRCLEAFVDISKVLSKFKEPRESYYAKREFERNLAGLIAAAHDGRNTMILSISHRMMRLIKAFLKDCDDNQSPSRLFKRDPDFDRRDVLLFQPFRRGFTVRIILFDAAFAGTDLGDEVSTLPADKADNMCLALISSYQAAGTGLNHVVKYARDNAIIEERDFDTLILTGSPFYSVVRDKADGLDHVNNHNTIIKHMAAQQTAAKLNTLSGEQLSPYNPKIWQMLWREHLFALLNAVMQAIGRVERRDAWCSTKIFIDDALFEALAKTASDLKRDPANKVPLQSLSMLNEAFFNAFDSHIDSVSFKSNEERRRFELEINDAGESIEGYFNEDYQALMRNSRLATGRDSIAFNEALRHIDSILDPEEYVRELKSIYPDAGDSFVFSVFETFFFNLENYPVSRLYTPRKNSEIGRFALTDMQHGDKPYQPAKWLAPLMRMDEGEELTTSFKERFTELKSAISTLQPVTRQSSLNGLMPNPAIMPLLKGNVGEFLFTAFLQDVLPETDTHCVNWLADTPGLPYAVYELFDRYLIQDNTLICIDVKHWSAQGTGGQPVTDFLKKSKRKVNAVKQAVGDRFDKVVFAYVNSFISQNDRYNLSQNQVDDLFFFNLFRRNEAGYVPIPTKERRKNHPVDHRLNDDYGVNIELTKLIQGE